MSEVTVFTSQQRPYSHVKVKNGPHSQVKIKMTLVTSGCAVFTNEIMALFTSQIRLIRKCKQPLNTYVHIYI